MPKSNPLIFGVFFAYVPREVGECYMGEDFSMVFGRKSSSGEERVGRVML
jgi:hypothetical protein